jgi:HEAT repeat protein
MKKLASSRRAVSDPSDRLTEVLSSGHDARTRIRLLRAVEDVSPIVAKRALKRLAEVGGPDEAKRLRELLFALDLAVIPACVQTLIALGDDISGGVAVKELSSSLNDIRLKAALVLREVANPSSAPALRATLQDPLANVRRVALEALACIPDDGKNLAAALDLADDEDETVRAALVRAVVALDVNPGPTLACFLEDPAAAVRLALARNTASLSAGAISLLLEDGNYDVRSQTLWSLVEEPRPELADAIVTRLEDNHWAVRRAACRALGAAEAEGAFRPLLFMRSSRTTFLCF